ncbi:MAG: hypothetical protein II295_05270 [Akkermansia sp.]|jgi:hypothetical protein|nr:hypothetical protein [Akkermansia sp.]
MKKEKNITRFSKENGKAYTFRGWRLCITRNGERFVRYFSELKCGGADGALAQAVAMRDEMLRELQVDGTDSAELFRRYRRMGNEC